MFSENTGTLLSVCIEGQADQSSQAWAQQSYLARSIGRQMLFMLLADRHQSLQRNLYF